MSSYTIPTVVETSPRGDRMTDVYSRLLSERIVFLGTPIDDGVANVVIAQLLHLASAHHGDIQLYVNSPGGSFSATMAIYDTMQFVGPDVATLCVGQASASAAILLAAGAPGKRTLLEHARVLLHQPVVEGTRGSMSDLSIEAAEVARVRAEAELVLARHTGRPIEQLRADTDRALLLSGAAAVQYGVADALIAPSGREQRELTPLRPGA